MLKTTSLPAHQYGFTVIELIVVIVIVILGVLSAAALPRFIDISSDAKKATLESMGGAILSAANLVHVKAIIKGVQNEPLANLDLDSDGSDDVEIKYGYLSASRSNSISNIMGSNFASEWT